MRSYCVMIHAHLSCKVSRSNSGLIDAYQICMGCCLFDVFSDSCYESIAIFKVGIKIGLISYGASGSFNQRLLIGKRSLVQYFNVRQGISQGYSFVRHAIYFVPISTLQNQKHLIEAFIQLQISGRWVGPYDHTMQYFFRFSPENAELCKLNISFM